MCVFFLGRLHGGKVLKGHGGACGRKHGVAGLAHPGPGSFGKGRLLEVPAFPRVSPGRRQVVLGREHVCLIVLRARTASWAES